MAFNWKNDPPSGPVCRDLVGRLDRMIAQIDAGNLEEARYRAYLNHWLGSTDLNGFPPDVLMTAKAYTDEAARLLDPRNPDSEKAAEALTSARDLFI